MAVTHTPEVGKFLVKQAASTALYRWYEPGGKIVRIAGQRVYYKADDGSEKFTHEYACVCDTQAEVKALLDFSTTEKKALEDYMSGIAERNERLTAKLAGATKPSAATAGATPRVRRSR